MGTAYIVLSVCCSLLLAHLLKLGEVRGCRMLNVLTVNYLIAMAAASAMNRASGLSLIPSFPVWFWLFCAFIGFIFIANFFIFSRSVHRNGVGVSIAAMRVSLLLPVLISLFFYGEVLTIARTAGILLVFAALFLIMNGRRDLSLSGVESTGYLIILFLFSGIADASLKIYDEEMSSVATEAHLMSTIFFFSLLFGVMITVRNGTLKSISGKEMMLGAGIGIPNLLSSIFLIRAFAFYDASVVYSVVNMMVVAGGTLLGLLIWKDRVSRPEAFGLVAAIAAIATLTLF